MEKHGKEKDLSCEEIIKQHGLTNEETIELSYESAEEEWKASLPDGGAGGSKILGDSSKVRFWSCRLLA